MGSVGVGIPGQWKMTPGTAFLGCRQRDERWA